MTAVPHTFALPLAGAVVYPSRQPPEALLAGFAAKLQGLGFRLGGVLQHTSYDAKGRKTDMVMVEVDSGRRLSIAQVLGRGAGGDGLAVDPSALAETSEAVRRAVAGRVDLVLVNKFSTQERAGQGLAAEMLAAMSEGLPLLTAVPATVLADWMRFCGGCCEVLPADESALWRWWRATRLGAAMDASL